MKALLIDGQTVTVASSYAHLRYIVGSLMQPLLSILTVSNL